MASLRKLTARMPAVPLLRTRTLAFRKLRRRVIRLLANRRRPPGCGRLEAEDRPSVFHQWLDIELVPSEPVVRMIERIFASTAAAIKASRACDSP